MGHDHHITGSALKHSGLTAACQMTFHMKLQFGETPRQYTMYKHVHFAQQTKKSHP
jgi:hypothetical protein